MPKKKMAKFERCSHFRELAGLTLNDLVVKLSNKPSKSSLVRLEDGYAILSANAFRVANEINRALKDQGLGTYDPETEVKRQGE
jgi:CRISPR/Cas system-associated protein Cas7 (RAMP superfamily)